MELGIAVMFMRRKLRKIFCFLYFRINRCMKNKRLQAATGGMLQRYGDWCTHMLTLTLLDNKKTTYIKRTGWDKGAVQHYDYDLTDDAAKSSIRYFIEKLNYVMYGRRRRMKRYKNVCKIIALPIYEGAKSTKRRHFHVLLGNIPASQLAKLRKTISDTWMTAKWAMKRVDVKEIHDIDGIAHYLQKEIGYCNDEAVLWERASIPGRLQGKW